MFVCVAANKSKVFWGIPRDPDLVAALQELEDEESEMVGDDEKPKVGMREGEREGWTRVRWWEETRGAREGEREGWMRVRWWEMTRNQKVKGKE